MRKRHSKAMRASRRHVRREVGIGVRLPADHDEIAGEVAEQDVALDLRVLCGTGHAEAHVSVRLQHYGAVTIYKAQETKIKFRKTSRASDTGGEWGWRGGKGGGSDKRIRK